MSNIYIKQRGGDVDLITKHKIALNRFKKKSAVKFAYHKQYKNNLLLSNKQTFYDISFAKDRYYIYNILNIEKQRIIKGAGKTF